MKKALPQSGQASAIGAGGGGAIAPAPPSGGSVEAAP